MVYRNSFLREEKFEDRVLRGGGIADACLSGDADSTDPQTRLGQPALTQEEDDIQVVVCADENWTRRNLLR